MILGFILHPRLEIHMHAIKLIISVSLLYIYDVTDGCIFMCCINAVFKCRTPLKNEGILVKYKDNNNIGKAVVLLAVAKFKFIFHYVFRAVSERTGRRSIFSGGEAKQIF